MAPKFTLRFDMGGADQPYSDGDGFGWDAKLNFLTGAPSSCRTSHHLRTPMDEEETELRNPFPSPPSHYQNYTAHNLKLLGLLSERAEPEGIDLSNVNQRAILSDQLDVPEWPLAQLEKPRVDWILEEGHYTVFGDTWQVSLVPSSFSA